MCQIHQIQQNKNRIFLDALFKSDERGDRKQEFFYTALVDGPTRLDVV